MQNQRQSRLGLPRFPALQTVFLLIFNWGGGGERGEGVATRRLTFVLIGSRDCARFLYSDTQLKTALHMQFDWLAMVLFLI